MKPSYTQRNALLPQLGFPTYADYLNSELWAEIRDAILDRDKRYCKMCGRRAFVVHHIDYAETMLLGESLDSLVSLCHSCHQDIEFTKEGRKRTLLQAMGFYHKRLKKQSSKRQTIEVFRCVGCRNQLPQVFLKGRADKDKLKCKKCRRVEHKGVSSRPRCLCGNLRKKNRQMCRKCKVPT